MTALAPTLQAFFTERLIRQRQVSHHTIAAYRDTLKMLVAFASKRKAIPPSRLDIDDLDAPLISSFLDHLERDTTVRLNIEQIQLVIWRRIVVVVVNVLKGAEKLDFLERVDG